ncbi:hypothetical protein D3C85_1449160 [compost metagenome]
MNNGIRHRFGDNGLQIVQLLYGRIELGDECGYSNTRERFVLRTGGEGKRHLIRFVHETTSRLVSANRSFS